MAVSYTTVAPVACTAFVMILLALTILLDDRATNAEAFRTHRASHARYPTASSLRPTRRCVVHGKLSHPPLSQNFDPYVDYSNAELQTILDAFLRRASSLSIALAPTRLELSTRRPVRSVVDSADARLADRRATHKEGVHRFEHLANRLLELFNDFLQRGVRDGTLPRSRCSARAVPYERRSTCLETLTPAHAVWYDVLYRRQRTYGFQVKWELHRLKPTAKGGGARMVLRRATIVGNVPQQDLGLRPGGVPYTERTSPLDRAYAQRVQLPVSQRQQALRYRERTAFQDAQRSQYFCVDQPQFTRELTCTADCDEFGRSKPRGTWDRPCRTSSECPFYKANRNYPNERGGCIDGKCEMPVHVRRIGFRKYDKRKEHEPYCHNCKNVGFLCCREQGASRGRDPSYSQMVTPDYVFPGDELERNRYAAMLTQRGMTINPKIVAIVPADVYTDYLTFVQKRDPRHIVDFYGTRRDVAELVLLQRALFLGGNTTEISIEEGELSYLAIKDKLTASDSIHLTATTVWRVDFLDDSSDQVFLSDPMIRQGEFEAGIYVKASNVALLNRNGAMTRRDVRKMSFVSSKQWTIDWKTLADIAPRAVYDTPKWSDMTKMVFSGDVDALLAPFQSTEGMKLDIVDEKGRTQTMLPVQRFKVGLSGTRHFAVANNPGSKKVLFQLNTGMQQMRQKGEIARAYRECGFFNEKVRRWKRLP